MWPSVFGPLLLCACVSASSVITRDVFASPSSYYVDATYGSDSNDGLTSTTAWQSLDFACQISSNATGPTASLFFAPGNYTVDPIGCNMNWHMVGQSTSTTFLNLLGTVTLGFVTNISHFGILVNVTPGTVGFYHLGGNFWNLNINVISGAAIDFEPGFATNTFSMAFSTVSYNVPNPDPVYNGLILVTSWVVNFDHVNFIGTYWGGYTALQISNGAIMTLTNSLFANHSGLLGAITVEISTFSMFNTQFINNVALGPNNASCITFATNYLFSTPHPVLYVPKVVPNVVVGPIYSFKEITYGVFPVPQPTYISNCSFIGNSAPNGVGAILWSDVVADPWAGPITITNTTFDSNSGLVGALWLSDPQNTTLSFSTFTRNVGSVFGAISISYCPNFVMNNVLIDSSLVDIFNDDNSITPSTVSPPNSQSSSPLLTKASSSILIYHTWATITSNIFTNSSAPYCPHIYVYNSTGSIIQQNTFGSATSWDTAATCVAGFGSYFKFLNQTGPNSYTFSQNSFEDTVFMDTSLDYMVTATQVNIWNSTVTLQNFQSFGSPDVSSLAIGDGASVTLVADVGDLTGTANLPGIITYDAQIGLQASRVVLTGKTSFLTMADSHGIVNSTSHIYSDTSSVVPLIIAEFSISNASKTDLIEISTWFQDVHFVGVSVEVYHPSVFCCNVGGFSTGVIFESSTLTLEQGYHLMRRNFRATDFVGVGSSLFVGASAILDAAYPIRDFAREERQVINGNVTVAGSLRAVDVVFTGTLTVLLGGELTLYPSQWNYMDHRIVVLGDFILNSGSLGLLDETFGILPFLPLLNFSSTNPPSYALVETHTSYPINYAAFASNFIQYLLAQTSITNSQAVVPSSPASLLSSQAISLVPYARVDDSLSAIHMEFLIAPDVPYDCAQLISNTSTQFNQETLTCNWESSKILRIASTSLPYTASIVSINPSNPEIATPYFGLNPPLNPPTPTAIIRPLSPLLPCDVPLLLDGSLSGGLGSFPASFVWTLQSTNDSSPSLLYTILANATGAMVTIPAGTLTPNCFYSFTLMVTNYAGLSSSSQPVNVTRVTPIGLFSASHPPQLAVDGPPARIHYIGNPLLISARVISDACILNDFVVFIWKNSSTNTIIQDSQGPSLLISAFNFSSPTTVSIQLTAFYLSNPSLSTIVNFTINVQAAPFFLVQESPSQFFSTNPILTVGLRGFNSSGALTFPTFSWRLVSCPSIDGSQARTSVQGPSTALASSNTTDVSSSTRSPTCLHSDGTPFPVTLLNPTTSTSFIDYTTIDQGLYMAEVTVNIGVISQSLNFSFELLAPNPLAPVVFIHLPEDVSLIQTTSRIYFEAVVNGITGTSLLSSWILEWQIFSGAQTTFGGAPSTIDLSQPNLVIPYASLIQGQLLAINVIATNITNPAIQANYTSVFNPSTAPFGGQLFVSSLSGPLGTTFNFSSSSWSALYPPLKYQFSLVNPLDQDDIIYLTDLLDVSFFSSSVSLPTSSNMTMLATLTVFDALGSPSTSQVPVTFQSTEPSSSWTLDSDLLAMADSLEQAVNNSDWKAGAALVSPVIRALVDRSVIEQTQNPSDTLSRGSNETLPTAQSVDSIVLSELVSSIQQLASQLPNTRYNTAAIMNQISKGLQVLIQHVPLSLNQSSVLLDIIYNSVSSSNSQFGRASPYSYSSTVGLIKSMTSLGSNAVQQNLSVANSVANTLSTHGDLVLADMIPGEQLLQVSTTGIYFEAHQRNVSSGSISIQSGGFGVSLSIDSSQFSASTTSGYFGYHHLQYNNTFPGTPKNSIGVVSVINFIPYGSAPSFKRLQLSNITRVVTNFTSTFNETPSCATYDSSTSSWDTSGSSCTTTSASSTISCDCSSSSGTGLTVLFGISSSPPSGPLSTGDIAAIAACGAVALIVIFVIILIVAIPSCRQTVQPYFGTKV